MKHGMFEPDLKHPYPKLSLPVESKQTHRQVLLFNLSWTFGIYATAASSAR